MPKKILAALAIILLLATLALAREGSRVIYGAVSDNGQPVVGARVTAIGEATYTSRNVLTDDQGVYLLEKLPKDEYMIQVLGPENGVYVPAERNVILDHDKKEVNFKLKRK